MSTKHHHGAPQDRRRGVRVLRRDRLVGGATDAGLRKPITDLIVPERASRNTTPSTYNSEGKMLTASTTMERHEIVTMQYAYDTVTASSTTSLQSSSTPTITRSRMDREATTATA